MDDNSSEAQTRETTGENLAWLHAIAEYTVIVCYKWGCNEKHAHSHTHCHIILCIIKIVLSSYNDTQSHI